MGVLVSAGWPISQFILTYKTHKNILAEIPKFVQTKKKTI